MKKSVLFALLAAALAGCVSVTAVDQGKNLAYVSNENLLLFNWLPICSGDPDYPNGEVANWWEDTVKVQTNLRLLAEKRDACGARRLANVSTSLREDWVFWPILKRKVLGTSAELVK